MNNLARTVKEVIETNIPESIAAGEGKKAYQLVKLVTGKAISTPADYECLTVDSWYGYDSLLIAGSKGYIRFALTPLFQAISNN